MEQRLKIAMPRDDFADVEQQLTPGVIKHWEGTASGGEIVGSATKRE
jgi:hypothetical protein